MSKEQAEQKLKDLYKGFKGLRDAFHSEREFVDDHIAYLLEKGGGTWNDQIAKEFLALLLRSQ